MRCACHMGLSKSYHSIDDHPVAEQGSLNISRKTPATSQSPHQVWVRAQDMRYHDQWATAPELPERHRLVSNHSPEGSHIESTTVGNALTSTFSPTCPSSPVGVEAGLKGGCAHGTCISPSPIPIPTPIPHTSCPISHPHLHPHRCCQYVIESMQEHGPLSCVWTFGMGGHRPIWNAYQKPLQTVQLNVRKPRPQPATGAVRTSIAAQGVVCTSTCDFWSIAGQF